MRRQTPEKESPAKPAPRKRLQTTVIWTDTNKRRWVYLETKTKMPICLLWCSCLLKQQHVLRNMRQPVRVYIIWCVCARVWIGWINNLNWKVAQKYNIHSKLGGGGSTGECLQQWAKLSRSILLLWKEQRKQATTNNNDAAPILFGSSGVQTLQSQKVPHNWIHQLPHRVKHPRIPSAAVAKRRNVNNWATDAVTTNNHTFSDDLACGFEITTAVFYDFFSFFRIMHNKQSDQQKCTFFCIDLKQSWCWQCTRIPNAINKTLHLLASVVLICQHYDHIASLSNSRNAKVSEKHVFVHQVTTAKFSVRCTTPLLTEWKHLSEKCTQNHTAPTMEDSFSTYVSICNLATG